MTKRIAGLERRLVRERDKCERLLAFHHARVRPLEIHLAGRFVDLHGLTTLSERAAEECMRERIVDLRADADELTEEAAVVSHATRKGTVMRRVLAFLARPMTDWLSA